MRLVRTLALAAVATPLAAQAPLTAAQRDAWAGLLRLADARDAADTVALDRALAAGDPMLRRVALRAIGQVRMRARYGVLRGALAAPDTGDAAEAAFALGIAADSASCTPLQGALRRGGAVGVEAAWSLGELGPRCLATEAMLAAAPDDDVRERVLEVAGRNRTMPVAPLLEATRSPAPRVRSAAYYALARTRRREGAVVAMQALRDSVPSVAEHAARLLAKPLVADSMAPFAIMALGEWSHHAQPHVRIAALRALATWGPDVADELLLRLGTGTREDREPDANVRVAVAQALDTSVVRDPARWRAAWDADTTFMVRRSLLVAAVRSGVALPAIEAWRTDADWRRRAAVAEAGGGAGRAGLARVAEPLLADADGRVRAAAAGSLAGWADSARSDGGTAYRDLLRRVARDDADFYARATALEALARTATAADVAFARDAYLRAAGDTGNDARLGALRLLAGAWKNDSARVAEAERRALAALPVPDDLLLRAAVANVGPLAAWARAPHPARPVAAYRAIVQRYVEPARRGRGATMVIESERGPIRVALACTDVPLTCAVFDSLASARFWRGTRFHRVVPAFVAQDGDPRGDGNGGPGFAIRDELNRRRYRRGAVGMALSGPDTGGSQYFLTLSPQPHLDGRYTVIGTVVAGEAAMDALVQGDVIRELRVVR